MTKTSIQKKINQPISRITKQPLTFHVKSRFLNLNVTIQSMFEKQCHFLNTQVTVSGILKTDEKRVFF